MASQLTASPVVLARAEVAKYKVGDNIGPIETVVEAVDGAWNKVTGEL